MRLVENARQAWRWFSIQLAVVGGSIQAAILAFPGFRDWLGDTWSHIAGVVMFLGIVLGRLVSQKKADA
jgi:hypothetical protein